MVKANVGQARRFIQAVFGVNSSLVWSEKGAILFSAEFDSPRTIPMHKLAASASKHFGFKVGTSKEALGASAIDVKIGNRRVQLMRYRGMSTVHILLVDSRESGWFNAI